ncbi:MAG TPA: thermonuclease family protein [Pseudomonas xinjiangensis]|uniref:Thermonuclease family protein n=2 Tax=root TaxID=1 RepID=A0A7V1BPG7_9GAMM|nr:thermonuclease family protein [Halopseudomonas xinjiangensis]HEC48332.1 thermonuclease family protein [Halopseudomonas xinjiangensis]
MATRDIRKALHWGAFFVCWCFVLPVLADGCVMPVGAEPVTSRFVIDGDTLELGDGRRVRLIGINAPETGKQGKPSEPFANAAKTRLQTLVQAADIRLVVGVEAKDRYGRTLGHLFDADGKNIEEQLLRDGMGFALAVPPNLALIQCHGDAERHARQIKQGVWQQSPVIEAAQVRKGGFQIITGRIESTSRAGGYVWLELDGSVVLRVGKRDRHYFGSLELDGLLGRRVEARGWVIDRRGNSSVKAGYKPFMLPLRHPVMLELE